jgi:hypothetical protein
VVRLARKWRSGVRLVASSRYGEGKRERMGAQLGAPHGWDNDFADGGGSASTGRRRGRGGGCPVM